MLLNSNHDVLDGRYSSQRNDLDDLPSIEAGDWHDGPHQYEDGYGDDGQDVICTLCAQAKRDYNRLPSLEAAPEGD